MISKIQHLQGVDMGPTRPRPDHMGLTPVNPGGSDSFIGEHGTATLVLTDYPSPSLTG